MDNHLVENHLEEKPTAELFSQYATLLLQWSWLLILLAVLAGGTAYFVSRVQTPLYQSTTLVMVNGAPGSQVDTYTTLNLAQQLTTTYAQIMVTQPILDGVAKKLNYSVFPATATIKAVPDVNTQLMTINVTDTDPNRAALIANTLVSVFADQIKADQVSRYADSIKSLVDQMTALDQKIQTTTTTLAMLNTQVQNTTNSLATVNDKIKTEIGADPAVLATDQSNRDQLESTLVQYQSQQMQFQTTQSQYQQSYNNLFQSYQNVLLAEAQTTSSIVQKDPAVPDFIPVAPQPERNALLAAVVGLMVAAGIIFLIEFLDDTIRDPQEIARRWGIPVLGMIVNFKATNGEALVTVKHPRSPISEAFRSLRTNLQFTGIETPVRTLLVTSPSPGDGKTTIVANLASVIAQSGQNVVIVDADLRRPKIHKMFQLSNRVGLSDQFIRTQENLNGSLKRTEVANLSAVTSGNLPPNPSELLSSGRMTGILKLLYDRFNTIIIDSPPTLLVTDAMVLAQRVDGVLLVVKPSVTKWGSLRQSIEQLQRVKANLVGIVVNDVNIRRSRYYYYRGYYRQEYGKSYVYADNDTPELAVEPKAAEPATAVAGPVLLHRIVDENRKE